jgi:hypothetical protein
MTLLQEISQAKSPSSPARHAVSVPQSPGGSQLTVQVSPSPTQKERMLLRPSSKPSKELEARRSPSRPMLSMPSP